MVQVICQATSRHMKEKQSVRMVFPGCDLLHNEMKENRESDS